MSIRFLAGLLSVCLSASFDVMATIFTCPATIPVVRSVNPVPANWQAFALAGSTYSFERVEKLADIQYPNTKTFIRCSYRERAGVASSPTAAVHQIVDLPQNRCNINGTNRVTCN